MNIRSCFLLLACAPLLTASTFLTDFTGFTPGDIQGQQGWGYPTNGHIKGTVVDLNAGTTPGFLGTQGLQLTSLAGGPGVVNGLFTQRIDSGAGEEGAPGALFSVFEASIWYRTADSVAPFAVGESVLQLNPSFAPPGGGCCADRYARLALASTTTGFDVYSAWPTSASDQSFNDRQVFASLNPGAWYHFGYRIDFNTGVNPDGSPNDVVTLAVTDVSGTSLGGLSGFTWESPWRAGVWSGGTMGPRTVNAFDFETFASSTSPVDVGILGSVGFSATPEPSTFVLFAAGAGGLAFLRRRRSGA